MHLSSLEYLFSIWPFIIVLEATVVVNEGPPPLSHDCRIIKLSPFFNSEVLKVMSSKDICLYKYPFCAITDGELTFVITLRINKPPLFKCNFCHYALKKYNCLPLVFPISICSHVISPWLSHFSTRIGYLSLSWLFSRISRISLAVNLVDIKSKACPL